MNSIARYSLAFENRKEKENSQSANLNYLSSLSQPSPTYNQACSSSLDLSQRSSKSSDQNNERPALLSNEELADIKKQACSGPMFSALLLAKLFTPSELIDCNVSGRGNNKNDNKGTLDKAKIQYIKSVTDKLYNSMANYKFWPACDKQMNRKILEICPENKPTYNFKRFYRRSWMKI